MVVIMLMVMMPMMLMTMIVMVVIMLVVIRFKFERPVVKAGRKPHQCLTDDCPCYKCSGCTKKWTKRCPLGCFSKDTLKENKKNNPVRNGGGPRGNISRRRG